MAGEYQLSYTGPQVNEKLGKIDTLEQTVTNLPDVYETKVNADAREEELKELISQGNYTLPTASSNVKGGVKIGTGLTITGDVLSYTLPTASTSKKGGVKIGDGLVIDKEILKVNVIDNLDSSSTIDPLSANQGRVLNESIAEIYENLSDLGAGDMLKGIYDPDGDGVVKKADDAILFNGHPDTYFMQAENPTGTGSLSVNRLSNSTVGESSVAIGNAVTASGQYSFAEGNLTVSSGLSAHAEGNQTTASGSFSHAEGYMTSSSANQAHAEGSETVAAKESAHAEGALTTSYGKAAHAEGNSTVKASTDILNGTVDAINESWSVAKFLLAKGDYSHAEGLNVIAYGEASHAEGNSTFTEGQYSHAEGSDSIATGNMSHAEGNSTQAIGIGSHAEGDSTQAIGDYSHAAGAYTIANNNNMMVIGQYNNTTTNYTITKTMGGFGFNSLNNKTLPIAFFTDYEFNFINGTITPINPQTTYIKNGGSIPAVVYNDNYYFVPGVNAASIESGVTSFYSGVINENIVTDDETGKVTFWSVNNVTRYTLSNPNHLFVVGNGIDDENRSNAFVIQKDGSVQFTGEIYALNSKTNQFSKLVYLNEVNSMISNLEDVYAPIRNPKFLTAISLGRKDETTIGENSIATGLNTIAQGDYSHAEGSESAAGGLASHAEGVGSVAMEEASHAEGTGTTANAKSSHSEGEGTTANAQASHAEGLSTTTSGIASHAEGEYTIAASDYQHAQGKYNIEDASNTYAHIIGNGTSNEARSNAHTIDWDGNAWFAGNITINEKITALNNDTFYITDAEDKVVSYVNNEGTHTTNIYTTDKEYTKDANGNIVETIYNLNYELAKLQKLYPLIISDTEPEDAFFWIDTSV